MKVYFMATPRGVGKLFDKYKLIYQTIESLGYEHVTDFLLRVNVDEFYLQDIRPFYKQTTKDLSRAEVCVFESSIHSLAVGHLIAHALENNKPVIVLYSEKNVPFFLSGIKSEKLFIHKYNENTVEDVLKTSLEAASNTADTRFNFFISKKLLSYLDWISKYRRIPRAVYLRQLLNREMRKYPEFRDRVK